MTTQLTIRVTKIVSCHGGGVIFKGIADDGKTVTVIAPYDIVVGTTIEPEDIWIAVGLISEHQQYGRQLNATDIEIEIPSHDLILDYLLNSPRFRNFGLGEKKVRIIWNKFGERLIEILDRKEVDLISGIEGISNDVATKMVDRWHQYSLEISVRKWLRKHSINRSMARKIIKIWGDDVIGHLELDPYELVRLLKWDDVDKLAACLGIARDDSRRLVGAVEAALFMCLDKADTLVTHEKMTKVIAGLLGMKDGVVVRAIETAKKALVLVGSTENGYQHRGIARLERRIKERLHNILNGETRTQMSLLSKQITNEIIIEGIRKVEQKIEFVTGKPSSLTPKQREAVQMAVEKPFGIICGGAGTGKTTILLAIHEILSHTCIPIYQMALTGCAAQRMRESTGRPASTIAKFCMEVKSGKRTVDAEALFIIDESSMVGLSTMYRILSYVPPGARLIMVGDNHQLPPFSFGLIFDKLIEAHIVPKVALNAVHRQTKSSGIPQVAEDIQAHRVPEGVQRHCKIPVNLGDQKGVHFIECPQKHMPGYENAEEIAWGIYEVLGMDPAKIRVLGAVKESSAGVNPINNMICHRLNENNRFVGTAKWRFAIGEEIIFNMNDYELGLNNGSLGTILDLRQTSHGWVMVAEWDDRVIREICEEKFCQIRPAYAMTVHKMQGSQFKKIICPIYKARNLDNSLIYTALTRGQEQVVFFGDWEQFVNAIISNKISDNRQVGFSI